jgi:lipopolysaccharide biosynthesis glycosyltransferase
LGEADIAIGLDASSTLGHASRWWARLLNRGEWNETLKLCGRQFPHFNTGVMLWRRNDRVRELFGVWHEEWKKYQRFDQWALCRAIQKTGVMPAVLPRKYNTFIYHAAPSKVPPNS